MGHCRGNKRAQESVPGPAVCRPIGGARMDIGTNERVTRGMSRLAAVLAGIVGLLLFALPLRPALAAAPTVTVATPDLAQGAAFQDVTIIGSGFTSAATVSFGTADVTVSSVTFISATQLVADVSTTATAALGVRTVTVAVAGS